MIPPRSRPPSGLPATVRAHPPPTTMAGGWREYRHTVLPADVGPIQRRETRRAFYAGAIYLFRLLMDRLSPGSEPTREDLAMLDAIWAEFERYAADLAAGRA